MRKALRSSWKFLAFFAVLATACSAKADSFPFTIDGRDFRSTLDFMANPAAQPVVDVNIGGTDWFWESDPGRGRLRPGSAVVINAHGTTTPDYSNNGLSLYDDPFFTNGAGDWFLDWGGLPIEFSRDEKHDLRGYSGSTFFDRNRGNKGFFYWDDNRRHHFDDPIRWRGCDPPPNSITPEPSSLLLLGSGLLVLALGLLWRAKQRQTAKAQP